MTPTQAARRATARAKAIARIEAARARALATLAGTYTPPPPVRVASGPLARGRHGGGRPSEKATALRSKDGQKL